MLRSLFQAASVARPVSVPVRFSTPIFATPSREAYSSDSKGTHAKEVIEKAKQEGKDAKIVVDKASDNPKLVIEETAKDEKAPGQRKKTVLEMDEELKLKLEGISGEGGASGLEYEDGKAVAMKRGVRDNMFRYI